MSIILAPLTGYILKASDDFQKDFIGGFKGLLGGEWEGVKTSWASWSYWTFGFPALHNRPSQYNRGRCHDLSLSPSLSRSLNEKLQYGQLIAAKF